MMSNRREDRKKRRQDSMESVKLVWRTTGGALKNSTIPFPLQTSLSSLLVSSAVLVLVSPIVPTMNAKVKSTNVKDVNQSELVTAAAAFLKK